jgi:hypothetical protein
MRTTVTAEPCSLASLSGFNTKTYAARPFPSGTWELVPVTTAIKSFDGVRLIWTPKTGNNGERNSVGFLAERLGLTC